MEQKNAIRVFLAHYIFGSASTFVFRHNSHDLRPVSAISISHAIHRFGNNMTQMPPPPHPITKQLAASVLSVSVRTIDTWIADGTIIAPHKIGRRIYWHPDVFSRWLSERLGAPNETRTLTTQAPQRRKGPGRPRSAPPPS